MLIHLLACLLLLVLRWDVVLRLQKSSLLLGDGGLVNGSLGMTSSTAASAAACAEDKGKDAAKTHSKHSDTNAGGNTSEHWDEDVGGNVLQKLNPVVAVVMAVAAVVMMRVMRALAPHLHTVTALLRARVPVAAAATLDLAVKLHHLLLDVEKKVLVVLLGNLLNVDAADDDLTGRSLDKSDTNSGHTINKEVADFDNTELDGDQLHTLLQVYSVRLYRQAVAKSLFPALFVLLDNRSDQVIVPWVSGGVELEAVQGKS